MTNRTNTYQSYSWEYKSQCSQDRYVVSLFCYVAYYYLDGGVLFFGGITQEADVQGVNTKCWLT